MTTKLTTPLRREVDVDGEPLTVVLSAQGVRLSRKRFREGRVLTWSELWRLAGLDHADGTNGVARRIQ